MRVESPSRGGVVGAALRYNIAHVTQHAGRTLSAKHFSSLSKSEEHAPTNTATNRSTSRVTNIKRDLLNRSMRALSTTPTFQIVGAFYCIEAARVRIGALFSAKRSSPRRSELNASPKV